MRYGLHKPVNYTYEWFTYDNGAAAKGNAFDAASSAIPTASGSPYLALDIRAGGNETRRLTVYLKQAASSYSIVGIDRVLN